MLSAFQPCWREFLQRKAWIFVCLGNSPRLCLEPYALRLKLLCPLLQRFRFRTVRKDSGVTHPKVIPVGPLHGMPMLID